MKTIREKFVCGASLRVEIGIRTYKNSRLVKIIIKPANSRDVSVTDSEDRHMFSKNIKEIRFNLWREQLDEILASIAKATK